MFGQFGKQQSGRFIPKNNMQTPPTSPPPPPLTSAQIEFLVPKAAQCSETYANTIF